MDRVVVVLLLLHPDELGVLDAAVGLFVWAVIVAGVVATARSLRAPPASDVLADHASRTHSKALLASIATFLSVAMMCDFLGQPKAAAMIQAACAKVVADPKNHTRDLGGTAGTSQVGDAVVAAL